jgi:hypothetical protein
MASVDRNTFNGLAKMTDVNAGGHSELDPFDGVFVFSMDAFPAFAMVSRSAMKNQTIDGGYGRAFNAGRGLVGEGGDTGPGVVGIAGNVIARPFKDTPRTLWEGPFPGQGWRAGVVGFGADPGARGERGAGDAVGVLGLAEKSLGVWGASTAMPGVFGSSSAHCGVYGWSQTTGVIGNGNAGQIGVEGFGNTWGVYGHVNYSNPNPGGVGVCGAAAMDLADPGNYTGIAGMFIGPVEVHADLTVLGNQVVWGTKSAAAKHTDGSYRLLYCVESAESQFEDFGEARLSKGRAKVRLDRDFAAVADTRHYHVFLTAYGDSNGLYVTNRTAQGFEVREQGSGTSGVRFSYRVVAKRKHVTTKRFQKIKKPATPKLPASMAAPETDVESLRAGAKRAAQTKQTKR